MDRPLIVHHYAAFAELARLDAVDVALDGHLQVNTAFREAMAREGVREAITRRARRRNSAVPVAALEDAVRRLPHGRRDARG